MTINRILLTQVSLERGLDRQQFSTRHLMSIRDGLLAFDDEESAESFALDILEAVRRSRSSKADNQELGA